MDFYALTSTQANDLDAYCGGIWANHGLKRKPTHRFLYLYLEVPLDLLWSDDANFVLNQSEMYMLNMQI